MKNVIAIVAVALVAGVLLWFLLPKSEPWPGGDGSAAVKADPAPPLDPGAPVSAAVGPPGERMDPSQRARLLAAIAEKIAQAQQRDAGAESPEDAATPRPRSKEWRKQVKSFQRTTTRMLMPLVRECLTRARKAQPEIASPDNKAVLTVESATGVGGAVTKVEVLGPDGPLSSPTLQGCLQDQAFFLRLDAAPQVEGEAAEPSVFSYPLLAPADAPISQ